MSVKNVDCEVIKSQPKEKSFPKLMRGRVSNKIVLFTNKREGFIVNVGTTGLKIGDDVNSADLSNYVEHDEVVCLQNSED
jgi:hypothetical protein